MRASSINNNLYLVRYFCIYLKTNGFVGDATCIFYHGRSIYFIRVTNFTHTIFYHRCLGENHRNEAIFGPFDIDRKYTNYYGTENIFSENETTAAELQFNNFS